MKFTDLFNTRMILGAMALCATPLFISCSDDDKENELNEKPLVISSLSEAEGIEYGTDGVWTGWDKSGVLTVGDIRYNHIWDYNAEWDFGTSWGFVASRGTDTADYGDSNYLYQFYSISGGGVQGENSPYFVCAWNTSEIDGTPFAERSAAIELIENGEAVEFTPNNIYVNNNTYAYYTMLNGNKYAQRFKKGDFFKVIAHGVKSDGSETTVEFYLANCTKDDAAAGIVKNWTPWDLTPLGVVKGIYFTMESSDKGDWGMNTPAYFAVDILSYFKQ